MERGVLVPDSVTIDMVMEWVNARGGGGGFLLDGFPRTLAQAKALDTALADRGGLDRALNIRVSPGELVRRLSGRLICRRCQTPYHMDSAPPAHPGECDRCGGELYQRDDDKPEAVAKRLEVYFEQTEPLAEHYRKAGILREVGGEGPIEDVTQALMEALG
jgi:adenylate kinase